MPLVKVLAARHPDLDSPEGLIAAGAVRVDGAVITNPRANVDPACRLVVAPERRPKGESKLGAALDAVGMVDLGGRVCLDVGASTGGFTSELLRRGAARVYAVDVGHGQLLGRLRQDERVVNLEGVNASALSTSLVPDAIDLMTVDVSYTPLAVVVPQVSSSVAFAEGGAVLLGLVKPMFELAAARLPTTDTEFGEAVRRASVGVQSAGWSLQRSFRSAVAGNRGAVEFWVWATRA